MHNYLKRTIFRFAGLSFLAAGLLIPGLAYSQYEENETVSVDDFREKVEFSYPKDGNPDLKSNGSGTHNMEAGHGEGDVSIDCDPKLDRLLTKSQNWDQGELMEGYRVQIYAGGNLNEANETRADFIEFYSEMPSYRLWVQPTFRIRVGDFVNRNAANQYCNEIRKHFPGAFVVPDRVKKPKARRNVHTTEDPDQEKLNDTEEFHRE
ncbi:MAG: SPOR domain-containing protein [Bacteroidia bacterium]|nr:SPOR domain-containing protein [Bacteroidia bacterium]